MKTINIGDIAPEFVLPSKNADGITLVSLKDSLKAGPVLILFVPMAFTGTCTEELCAITNELNTYKSLNATVLAISGDNPFAQEAWAKQERIGLTLLSDYDHKVTAAYGVAYDSFLPEHNLPMSAVPKRSAFVVSPDAKILYAEVNDDPSKLPNFEAIKSVLA